MSKVEPKLQKETDKGKEKGKEKEKETENIFSPQTVKLEEEEEERGSEYDAIMRDEGEEEINALEGREGLKPTGILEEMKLAWIEDEDMTESSDAKPSWRFDFNGMLLPPNTGTTPWS